MCRVLIVEDDGGIQEFLTDFIRGEGCDVLSAPNGAVGIMLARTAKPDLIFMDLMMPVMDGMTALRILKDDPVTRHIPIIAMSAGHRLRSQTDSLLAEELLPKPFDLDDVRSILSHYASSRFSGRSTPSDKTS